MSAKRAFYYLTYQLGRCLMDGGMSILYYHSIDDSGSRISLAPEIFREHMRLLHELGYRSMLISEVAARLRAGHPFPEQVVSITFDDGFENVYSAAAPAMREYGFTGTVFVVGGMVGRRINWRDRDGRLPQLPLMGWRQVDELRRQGFEIGAHTLSHPYLTRIAPGELWREIAGSRELLEERLGCPIESFAYPYGDHDGRVAQVVARAGFRAACTTKPTRLLLGDDALAMPRLFVARDTDALVLRASLSPGAALAFQMLSAVRGRRAAGRPWYVPDPAYTDSSGTVAST